VADALAFSRLLTARAHRQHVAIAQKNGAEISARGRRAGFDFVIAEQCRVFAECDSYTAVYGRHVSEIEYTDSAISALTAACALRGGLTPLVLRDRNVTPAENRHHAERSCR
jgi:hypothetical protein